MWSVPIKPFISSERGVIRGVFDGSHNILPLSAQSWRKTRGTSWMSAELCASFREDQFRDRLVLCWSQTAEAVCLSGKTGE